MRRIALLCFLILLTFAQGVIAQESTEGKGEFSALFYSDYYWMAKHHTESIEGNNGFWFRRIYLTYNHKISESYSGKVRLETSTPGNWRTNEKMAPKIKDAYLKWHNEQHQILAGISSTPTFGLIEDVWEYRSVEKSPADLYKLGSSRDFGIAAKGKLTKSGNLGYHVFLGNGNGVKPELNQGKKIMLALDYDLTDKLILQGYADWSDNMGNSDVYSLQGFIGYQSEELNFGALYMYQKKENYFPLSDAELDLVSLFGTKRLKENLKGYLRVDHMFDGFPNGSTNSYIPFAENVESTFFVGGIDYQLDEGVFLQPNVEAIVYGENTNGITPDTDIIPRLTLFYKF